MKSRQFTNDFDHFEIGSYQDWKFGLIIRDVHRISENEFEIYDTSDGWVGCVVDKKTFLDLTNGLKSLLELNWI